MTDTQPRARGGFSIFTVALAVFVTLKLTGVVHWSWLWVLAPLWGPYAVILVFMILFGTFAITAKGAVKALESERKYR